MHTNSFRTEFPTRLSLIVGSFFVYRSHHRGLHCRAGTALFLRHIIDSFAPDWGPLGPKAFPYLIGIGLLVSAAWLLLETLQAGKADAADPQELAEHANMGPEDDRHLLVIAGVVAWIAFYFALFEPVGFLLATPVFLLGLMVYFNRNKWVANVLTSVLFPVGIYFYSAKCLASISPRACFLFRRARPPWTRLSTS